MFISCEPHSTDLARRLTHDFVYKPFPLDISLAHVAKYQRIAYNCRVGEPDSNEMAEWYGQATYILSTRIGATCFLMDNSKLTGSKLVWAIEYFTRIFTGEEYMARIMASSSDTSAMRVHPIPQAQIEAWSMHPYKNIECPARFADVLEALTWAADVSAGFHAVVEHNHDNLRPAFGLLSTEAGIRREIQTFWKKEHNEFEDENHVYEFLRRFDLITPIGLECVFGALKETFSSSAHLSLVDSNGDLHQRLLSLAYLGFAVQDYFFRKTMDSWYPRYRASIIGGAHFGKTLKRVVLCDTVQAHIAVKMDLCPFPQNGSAQLKAQLFSAAIGQRYLDGPESMASVMRLPMGMLVPMAHDVVSRLSSSLVPTVPDDDTLLKSAPVAPNLPSVTALAASSSSHPQTSTTISKADKTLKKGSASASTSQIASSTPIAGPSSAAGEMGGSSRADFVSKLKARLPPSTKTGPAEPSESTSLFTYLPPKDGPPESRAAVCERLLRRAQTAAKDTKQAVLRIRKPH
ncbi:hypothetical protein ONZ45_g12717 [Pleurotus djamor]|nr:hypothetical protein ONZ45_g12717 [Pleurotus djamor]